MGILRFHCSFVGDVFDHKLFYDIDASVDIFPDDLVWHSDRSCYRFYIHRDELSDGGHCYSYYFDLDSNDVNLICSYIRMKSLYPIIFWTISDYTDLAWIAEKWWIVSSELHGKLPTQWGHIFRVGPINGIKSPSDTLIEMITNYGRCYGDSLWKRDYAGCWDLLRSWCRYLEDILSSRILVL